MASVEDDPRDVGANAIVHFWLSDDEGNYDMVGHKLQGYTVTDPSGRYSMEMIVPVCYEPRQAKHIHVKVQGVSRTLTTQLFFSDDEGRLRDLWFNPELEIKMEEGATAEARQLRLRDRAGARRQGQRHRRNVRRAGRLATRHS